MPSDRFTTSNPAFDRQPVSDGNLKAWVRAELARYFTWPPSARPVARPLQDLSAAIDTGRLAEVAAAVHDGGELSFTLISKEYIQTGLNWINAMQRLGRKNFLVIAGDQFAADTMDQRGIHSVRANIDEDACDPSLVTHIGFSAKGLAMIALKFPVAKFLLQQGYSVVFSDADAVWLQDPMPYLREADIAFQRVIYHPPSISSLWGFAVCTGFVSFRNGPKMIGFLDRCIEAHQIFYCDQVSMNVALFDENPDWRCEQSPWTSPGVTIWDDEVRRRAIFTKFRQFPINGDLPQSGLKVLALPNDKFWRQKWVSGSFPDMVICHPNAPKDDLAKMTVFDAMGIRIS